MSEGIVVGPRFGRGFFLEWRFLRLVAGGLGRISGCCVLSRKSILAGIAFLWAASAFTHGAAAQQDPTPGVVKIQTRNGEGVQKEGSGFVVGFDRGLTFIATAAHVVGEDARPRVVFAVVPHLTFEATPVRIEIDSDVAVLKIFGFVPGTVALPLDQRPVELADPLQAIGFPRRSLQPHLSTAVASSKDGSRIVLDEELAEGHSGGPLLREGRVVGLVNATDRDFAYATPTPFISQALAGWRVPFQMQTTQRAVAGEAPIREPESEESSERGSTQIPVRSPLSSGTSRCIGEVASRTGSGQPIRIAASPSARAVLSLPAGTRVVVQATVASSGYKWYEVVFNTSNGSESGWIQADHLTLAPGCRL